MPNLRDFPIDQKMPSKNDVLFFIKRRVVFHKTTACFIQCFGVEISLIKKQMEKHKINRENTCSLYLSRVRAHAHYRSFSFFAVTSVTALRVIYWNLVCYRCFWSVF